MPFLTINGITVKCAPSSGDRTHREIGVRERAYDGTQLSSIRARKLEIAITTAPLSGEEARALSSLLRGEGHVWSFDTDLYSSKWLGKKTHTGTEPTPGGSGGKFGNKLTIPAASTVTWAAGLTRDYTVMVWRHEAAAWKHYIVRRSGNTVKKWVNGVSDDAASTPWLTVESDGDLLLGESGSVDAVDYDDLVALPVPIPSSWVSPIYESARAFPGIPTLEADGAAVDSPTTPLQMEGRVERESPEPHNTGSAWDPAGRRVEFVLMEI